MALVLAVLMIAAMVPAMAEEGGTTNKGTITINSPVVSATYNVYKVFDMSTIDGVTSFSYTIDTNNPFYTDIATWANTPTNGLVLSEITSERIEDKPETADVNETYKKFNVQASITANSIKYNEDTYYGIFDAQAFGQMLLAAMNRDEGKVTPTVAATKKVEVADSAKITFSGLGLGYYLINATYPPAAAISVPKGAQTFTVADLKEDEDGNLETPYALSTEGEGKVDAYVNATVDATYAKNYVNDNGITTKKNGDPLDTSDANACFAEYGNDLKTSMKADAIAQIIAKLTDSKLNPGEADINVKEPILVFLDSSKPDAVINEKNELDKWDVPVNPEGTAKPGTPDHGEPKGGKNIVVGETENGDPIYGDWTEAYTGEPVHYQLRVNAMNFINTSTSTTLNQANADSVVQVKEYFLADYQSAQMEFVESEGLKVSIWQGDNNNKTTGEASSDDADKPKNVTKKVVYDDEGTVTVSNATELDYTDYGTGKNGKSQVFFKNTSEHDGGKPVTDGDIFGTGTGIMVPWVIVSEDASLKNTYPIYTTTKVPVEDQYETEDFKLNGSDKIPVKELNTDGEWVVVKDRYVSVDNHVVDEKGYLRDENDEKIQQTKDVYTYSIYNSDVTIVVDYWMKLKDNAIVDEPGNVNYAQYGWSPVDNKDSNGNPKTPTNPEDSDKPSKKEEIDEATVYTYALAWVKIDDEGNELSDAEFELPFYVKNAKDGKAYVYAFKEAEDLPAGDNINNYTNKVTTTVNAADGEKGVIVIKGVEQGTYPITETFAPAGYNKLTAPFNIEAKKSGVGVTTKTKTITYFDANGKITDTVTTATKEYSTDVDSYQIPDTSEGAEEGATVARKVPVYQFLPVVNQQGTELPATGGMGTTIFYVAGSILVLAAAILLITKRRMGSED